MKKCIILCVFLLAASFSTWTQEAESPDIYLPSVVLEVQDTGVSRLTLPNPIIPEQAPGIPGVLVETDGNDSEFQLLAEIPLIDPLGGETSVSNRRFFSEGTIGVGSANRLYGNIELTQISRSGPGFTAGFLHDSSDGFYPHKAGDGFSNRDDSIYGTFVYLDDKLNVFAEGDIGENAWGFQGLGNYIDAVNRSGKIYTEAEYKKDWLSSTISADGMYINQVFGGANSISSDYSEITPRVDVEGEWEYASAGIFGQTRISEDSIWEIGSNISLDPWPWLGIKGGISVIGDEFLLPWYAGFDFSYFKGFTISASGGMKADAVNPRDLVDYAPMSLLLSAYPMESYWFAETELKVTPTDAITLSGKGTVFWDRDYYWLEDTVDGDGLIRFSPDPYYVDIGGKYSAECRYSTSLSWFISAAYVLDYLPEEILGIRNSLLLQGEYTEAKRGFVFNSTLEVPFETTSPMPLWDFSVEIPISRNINLEIGGTDLLSVLNEEGRTYIGDYQTKGFEISFFTKISL